MSGPLSFLLSLVSFYIISESMGLSVGIGLWLPIILSAAAWVVAWKNFTVVRTELKKSLGSNRNKIRSDTGAQIVVYDYGDVELWTHFEFTNFTDEVTSPLYDMSVKAFQNGRELSNLWDDSGWGDDILPGYSMKGYKAFALTD